MSPVSRRGGYRPLPRDPSLPPPRPPSGPAGVSLPPARGVPVCGTPPAPGEYLWIGDSRYLVTGRNDDGGLTVRAAPTAPRPANPIRDRLVRAMCCGYCLRLRVSPGHWAWCRWSRG